MVTNIIAIFLIIFFTALTIVTIGLIFFLKKTGLLKGFLRGRLILSLLSVLFVVAFIASGVGLLKKAEWAVPAMTWTIYLWLAYVWLYNLKKILDLVALLKWETAASISQFMGRDRFFDELLEKSIDLSKKSGHADPETAGEAHGVSDSQWETLIDDEEWFKEVFPQAVRKKIRRKLIGLLVHTLVFVIILWLLQ